jgi:hypothetical protein
MARAVDAPDAVTDGEEAECSLLGSVPLAPLAASWR